MMKILLLVILLFSHQAFALGRTINYDELLSLFFGAIEKITSCGGYNKEGNKLGGYRLIQAHIYGGTMLFVDQVEFHENYLQVISGIGFSEINNDHLELNIVDTTCKSSDSKITVTGTVNGTGHEEQLTYKFQISIDMEAGKYDYKEF